MAVWIGHVEVSLAPLGVLGRGVRIEFAGSLLGIAGNVSAPTFDELYSGKWEHPTCCG